MPLMDKASYPRYLPYYPVYIDAYCGDFATTVSECLRPTRSRASLYNELHMQLSEHVDQNHVIPCLSVRTGLDLYLSACQFAVGSHILITAVNIPDIITILEMHGLIPLPLDVNLQTLSTELGECEGLIRQHPTTVAILIAHLFQKRCPMDGVIALARRHRLRVIEDCAEAFSGPRWLGHPSSDLALFSFGPIKFCTGFGGGVARVRHAEVYERMVSAERRYETQSTSAYLARVLKAGAFFACSRPGVAPVVTGALARLKVDYRQAVSDALRMSPGGDARARVRQRPCDALLFAMARGVARWDARHAEETFVKGEFVARSIGSVALVPGKAAPGRSWWLFPIVVENKDEVRRQLNRVGIEAHANASQLTVVSGPDNQTPVNADFLIRNILFLPVHRHVPWTDINYIVENLCEISAPKSSSKL